MRQIPTRQPFTIKGFGEYRSIKYDNEIFVIELNENGNSANFQYDGVGCRGGVVKGFVFKTFRIYSKWFRPSIWYQKTCWGKEYPKKVYFSEKKYRYDPSLSFFQPSYLNLPVGEERSRLVKEAFANSHKRQNELAENGAIESSSIIKQILRSVNIKTKINFELDFDALDYGEKWSEAYVPLKYKNKKYLLTWGNCD